MVSIYQTRRVSLVHGLLGIGLLLMTGLAAAKTLYVDQWGNDSSECGAKNEPCLTIEQAIDNARKNDRIIVGPGRYIEHLIIFVNTLNEPLEGLKLESVAGRNGTIIQASAGGQDIINASQSKVQIGKKGKGFSFLSNLIGGSGDCVELTGERFRVEGNRMQGCNGNGLAINGGERSQVRFNRFLDNAFNGFRCNDCTKSLTRDNYSRDNNANGFNIGGNGSSSITVQKNVGIGNFSENFLFGFGSAGVKLKDNVSTNSNNEGFQLDDANGAFIQGNISMEERRNGFLVRQQTTTKGPNVKNNLAVYSGATEPGSGFLLRGWANGKSDGNTSIWAADHGFNLLPGITYDASFKSFKNNTAIVFFSCSISNDSGNDDFKYTKLFPGAPGSPAFVCGANTSNGTISNKPTPIRVNGARSL